MNYVVGFFGILNNDLSCYDAFLNIQAENPSLKLKK